jgi:uncharacterized damage-inducible protein DinB
MSYGILVDQYLLGPEVLRRSISGMSDDDLNSSPIPFKWSTRKVVLHLADVDLVYVDHMKRVIADEEPTLLGIDDKLYGSRLAYDKRDIDEEVWLIMAMRRHMVRILRAIDADAFRRKGIHSVEGPLTLADLLQRAADHIPHHVRYIDAKRGALRLGERPIPSHDCRNYETV